jgi:methionyl-tRNA formyltransferase
MLLTERLPITAQESAGSLHDRLAALGARLIVDALRRLQEGKLGPGLPQPASGVNYAAKISKQEAALDFSQPAALLARKICAFDPVPGASAEFSGLPLKIWRAEVIKKPAATATPGEICAANESGIVVACGEGALRLIELQKPGGRRLPASEFIKGFPMTEGRFTLTLTPPAEDWPP